MKIPVIHIIPCGSRKTLCGMSIIGRIGTSLGATANCETCLKKANDLIAVKKPEAPPVCGKCGKPRIEHIAVPNSKGVSYWCEDGKGKFEPKKAEPKKEE